MLSQTDSEKPLMNSFSEITIDSSISALDLILKVEGMSCTACASVIDSMLQKTEGITEVKTHFLTDMVQVKYLPHLITPGEILEKISSLGYHPSPFQEQTEHDAEKRNLLLRLGISALLSANVMMIAYALYGGFFQELSQSSIWFLSLPQLILATPVIFYGGYPIFKRTLAGLLQGKSTMDTLIATGALSAYGYSMIQMTRGSIHLYFDTAAMLVTLVLLGKYIEARARHNVSSGILELYSYASKKVRLSSGSWETIETVRPGDEFQVLPGERCPLDGRILSGAGAIDESILTGEARPLKKRVGEEVLSGSMLLDGELRLAALRAVQDSALGQTIKLMQEALTKKIPAELISDRLMGWLVPAILGLSVITAGYLVYQGATFDKAMLRALAILVITCPCTLGIAIPLAKVAFIRKAHERGIIIQDPAALEKVRELDTLVFDKTGTLTEGNFLLREIITEGLDETEALRLAASVEAGATHFIGRAIVGQAHHATLEFEKVADFEELQGLGVKGRVNGKEIAVGNRQLVEGQGVILLPELKQKAENYELQGNTVIFLGIGKKGQGVLVLGDALKVSSRKALDAVQARGIAIWLISGDSSATTQAVALQAGIARFQGQSFPRHKGQIIKDLQQEGKRVGMVGDGINDAAALVQADVGIAMLTGTNFALGSADIHLLGGDPLRVLDVMDLSAQTISAIRQNLFLAFIYNVLAIPLAMSGLINPLIAVTAMFASSLTVIGNTLRIVRFN
jgi:heavy metal translocating P-type ATPase